MKNTKHFLWRLFDILALLLSYVFISKISYYVRLFRNRAYSYAISRSFKKVGNMFLIEYPAVILGARFIKIGDNFSAFARLRLEVFGEHCGNIYSPEVNIGNNVSINYDCHIGCSNRIIIGNDVLMASRIFITDHYHGEINSEALKTPPALRMITSKGPVIIEENVWIGEGVAIMPNVKIGRNTIVGANAVVTTDLPPNCVAGGIPARVIRYLSE